MKTTKTTTSTTEKTTTRKIKSPNKKQEKPKCEIETTITTSIGSKQQQQQTKIRQQQQASREATNIYKVPNLTVLDTAKVIKSKLAKPTRVQRNIQFKNKKHTANIRTIDTYFQRENGQGAGLSKLSNNKIIKGLAGEPETPETLAETRPPEPETSIKTDPRR